MSADNAAYSYARSIRQAVEELSAKTKAAPSTKVISARKAAKKAKG
jgi:hypothetical protein